jgi:hypothetical protein
MCIVIAYAISEYSKTGTIDPKSEQGQRLTTIAEKAIEEEGIDTSTIILESINQESSSQTLLTFHDVRTYSTGDVYANTNLTDQMKIAFYFSADLGKYAIYSYEVQPENGRIYEENSLMMQEVNGYGNNLTLHKTADSIKLIDPETNKGKIIVLDYKIQDQNISDAVADDVNSKYAFAKQPIPIDKGKPYLIIDTSNAERNTRLKVEVWFSEGELSSMHTEKTIIKDDWPTVIHGGKYYNQKEN